MTLVQEAESFLKELFSTGVPLNSLLRIGCFPNEWPERYLAFVERVERELGEMETLPRSVVAVIYNASAYCTKRYHDWQELTGGTNDVTRQIVDRIRRAGDGLILGRYWNGEYRFPGIDA